jgi:hypothetical protein
MTYLKYLAVTIVIVSLFLVSCSKEESSSTVVLPEPEPSATQQATVFYFGGTWCGPCGSLGKPAKEALKKELGESKVSIITCQQADPMNIPDGNDLAKLFNADRVPYMYVGGSDEPSDRVLVLSSMSEDAVSKASAYLNRTPTANILASFYLNSKGLLQVDSKIKFFKDVISDYYAATYVIEDGIFETQTSDSSVEKNIHNSVLRSKMGTSITGDIISESSIKKDMVFKKTFEAVLDPKFKKEKLKAVVVIWVKNSDGSYFISNSIVTPIKN